MEEFSIIKAAMIFATYVVIDMLYAWYIISVNKRQAVTAAILTAIVYSLLAFGVVSYSKNIYYLVPLASGAFVGTYCTVKFKK